MRQSLWGTFFHQDEMISPTMTMGIPAMLADNMAMESHRPHGNTVMETAHMLCSSQTESRSVPAAKHTAHWRMVVCGRRSNKRTECQLACLMFRQNPIRMSCRCRCQPCKPQKPKKNPSLKGFHHVTTPSIAAPCPTSWQGWNLTL